MHPLRLLIDVFEGESRYLQWLTPLTMGYLFTLTGVWWHFALTIFAIAGARFSTDLGKTVRDSDRSYRDLIASGFDVSPLRGIILIVFGAPYAISLFYAPYLIYSKFVHTNIVLVVLAAVYLGIAAIVVQKLLFPEI